jgi:hypothetical protein
LRSFRNSTTYSQSGKYPDTARKRCNTGGNKLFGYRIMEFVCCSNTVLAIRFSVISRFCLKWRWIHQLIIRMPNWFWFPKTPPHFPEYDFHQRNGIQQPWNWSRIVHTRTHACDSKHTLDILFIELLKTVFWFNLFLFYKKKPQLNHEFLADEKVVNSYNNVPFYQSLLLQRQARTQLLLGQ